MIGILAGMGPRSTAPFINEIITQCQKDYHAVHDDDFPAMMIHSCPTPFRLTGTINHQAMIRALKLGVNRLSENELDIIAMPCQSAHMYLDEIQSVTNIPIINMIDETVNKITSSRVCVIATEMTINSGVYQVACSRKEIEFVAAGPLQEDTNKIISLIKSGYLSEAQQSYDRLLDTLEKELSAQLIIACTDLSALDSNHSKLWDRK